MVRADADALDRHMFHGVGVILIASVLFGVMAVGVRLASAAIPSSQIALIRFAGSLTALLAVTRGRGLRPHAGNMHRVLLRGVLGAGAIVLYYRGIEGAGAGLATLLNCTYPVFTALFASTLAGERFDRSIALALLLNLAGVGIVLGPGTDLSGAATGGALSALVAAVLAGGAVATARELRASESALLVTTYFMAVGAVLTCPSLLLGLPHMTPRLAGILAVVILSSVTGQWLLHHGLGVAPATQGSLAAAVSVVTAAGLETALLGERLSPHSLLGAGVMLLAIVVALMRRR